MSDSKVPVNVQAMLNWIEESKSAEFGYTAGPGEDLLIEEIANDLRDLRKSLGMDVVELGKALGIHGGKIAQAESAIGRYGFISEIYQAAKCWAAGTPPSIKG